MIFQKRFLRLALYSTVLFFCLETGSLLYAETAKPSEEFGAVTFPELKNADIGKYLGWVNDGSSYQYCGGYFLEKAIEYSGSGKPGQPIEETPVEIQANAGDLFLSGQSKLSGSVKVTQPNRQLIADAAYVYRDDQGDLNHIKMEGNVHLHEPGKLIVADIANVPIEHRQANHISLDNVIYRISLASLKGASSKETLLSKPRKLTGLTAWGYAKQVQQNNSHEVMLKHASYSTCPPEDKACMWHLTAYELTLNKESGRGQAYGSTLWLKKAPVMFLPYFSFPLNDQRKSGFLYPSFTESSDSGFALVVPFYINWKPNYDLTLSPYFYSQRGLYLGTEARYLTKASHGSFNIGIAPNDRKFADFQDKAQSEYAGSAELSSLENASTTRTSFRWVDVTRFDKSWSGAVDFNYASDDYFTKDFSQSFNEPAHYQLLREGRVNYYGDHWTFEGLLKSYQTLHPVDQDTISNQYARLPELSFHADYPDQMQGIEYTFATQFDYFYKEANPGESTDPVTGNRVHIQPGLSLPMQKPFGYITPTVQLSATGYQLADESSGDPSNPSRILPLMNIDSGLYFDRDVSFGGQSYTQTLTPRLYYLYVPNTDQDDLPDFDSVLKTLNYDRLFQTNRFSSVDRVGDANQLSLGVSTSLISQASGDEKLKLSVGDIWYLRDRDVRLCTSEACADEDEREFSPIVSEASYSISRHWSIDANNAYDFNNQAVENGDVTLGYIKDSHRVINFGYHYVRQGDLYTDNTSDSDLLNLSQLHASYAWPISSQWNTLGSVDFNTSYGNGMSFLLGTEYDTCCWGIRFLMSRQLTGVENGQNQYDSTYYLQFVLKGLGAVNSRDSQSLIHENIANYNDDFIRVF